MTMIHEPMQPRANIDDIVKIGKYGERRFKVVSFTYEFHRDKEVEIEEIYYEIMCLKSFETITADEESITIVKRAINPSGLISPTIRRPRETVNNLPEIDDLLDELSVALYLQEMFGDHMDDERRDYKYALAVCELKAKLRERVEVV